MIRPISAVAPHRRRRARGISPGPVLPLAALSLLLAAVDPTPFELEFARLTSEPWRLLTGHLVHYSTSHLVWDLLLFVGLGLLCERSGRRGTVLALSAAIPAIGLGLVALDPGLLVYRGLSGLDSALFALLATRVILRGRRGSPTIGVLALAGLLGKFLWEVAAGEPVFVGPIAGVSVVPAAHLIGALCGVAAACPSPRRPSFGPGRIGRLSRPEPETPRPPPAPRPRD